MSCSTFQNAGSIGADRLIAGQLYKLDSGYNQVFVVPADVSTITRKIISASDGQTVNSSTPLVVANVILNPPITGGIWTADANGFNFADQIPGALLTDVDGVLIKYVVTYANGTVVSPLAIPLPLRT